MTAAPATIRSAVPPSATLAINERIEARRRDGADVLHLAFGEAGLPVHPGVAEVLAERVGDAQSRGHDARDVGRRIADPFDRVRDPQDAGHPFGILGAPRGKHRHDPEAAEVAVHPLLEPADFAGQLLLVEEHGGVGQVDHELGGVLQLDEELFDGLGFVIHGAALPILT